MFDKHVQCYSVTRTDKNTGYDYGIKVQIEDNEQDYNPYILQYSRLVFMGAFKGEKLVGYGIEMTVQSKDHRAPKVTEIIEGNKSI